MEKQKTEKMTNGGQKVAIVHDFLVDFGGAERVLEDICAIFPEAPIYTLLYDKEKMRGKFENKEIRPSFLQKFPEFLRRRKRYLLPFMMVAPEAFDLRDFDLVVSSSGAWSKGIVTRLDTKHIAYVHSPMRFAWDYSGKYLDEIGKRAGILIGIVMNYLRIWDYQAAQRPDKIIANSLYTQKRIKKYYKRDSVVVYPGTQNVEREAHSENSESLRQPADSTLSAVRQLADSSLKSQNYFLVVSRLSAYKKVDLVVEAFNKLNLPLVVIGEGEQKEYLEKIANENVEILGWIDDEEIEKYYQSARAFIFPAVDDFGLTMVEAMNHGVPVIAIRKGGAKEIVQEGLNGEFFDAQTVEVLADGVRRFLEKEGSYDREKIKESVKRFSREEFIERMRSEI